MNLTDYLDKTCPCCSGKIFAACCYEAIAGKTFAVTAEALMRSRYTAFSMGNIAYIEKTMKGVALESFNFERASLWSQRAQFIGLEILDAGQQDSTCAVDEVEFYAKIVDSKNFTPIHERSTFHQEAGQWFYTQGQLFSTPIQKLTSFSLCPCDSKRKFSFCCGKKRK